MAGWPRGACCALSGWLPCTGGSEAPCAWQESVAHNVKGTGKLAGEGLLGRTRCRHASGLQFAVPFSQRRQTQTSSQWK